MRLWTIAFLIGIFIPTTLPSLPPLLISASLLILALILCFRYRAKGHLFLLAAVMFGFSWSALHAHIRLTHQLPDTLIGHDVVITGHIDSLPETQGRFKSFLFKTDLGRIKLNWYGYSPALHVGDEWTLRVRLKHPHGLSDPGSFDSERYYFQQHIAGTGYVKASKDNKLQRSNHFHKPIDRLREYLANKTNVKNMKGLITGLTLGIKSNITHEQWRVLRTTGTSHLMAISGLHVGLIAGFAYFIMNFLWRLSSILTLRLAAQNAAAIAAILAAVSYSALAGFAIPTQRALIMIVVLMSAKLSRRNITNWHALSLALLIVLIFDPFAVLSPGFWLSFTAVAIIFFGMGGRLNPSGLWWKWGRLQWVVTIGLLPLSLLFFEQNSLIGFAANLFAIPWVGFTVVPFALLGTVLLIPFPSFAAFLFSIASKALAILWVFLTYLSELPFASWQHPIGQTWIFIAALVGVVLILSPKGLPYKRLGVVYLFPLVFAKPIGPSFDEMWLTVLDVGQGLSTIIQTHDHVLVYDTGAKYSENYDMGSAVVVPYLRRSGISKVDTLVISHGDNDHSGGAQSLLEQISVNKLNTSVPKKFKKQDAINCHEGQHWQWGDVTFTMLSPTENFEGNSNNKSCVLLVEKGDKRILLTGDIEKKAEKNLVLNNKAQLRSDILIVPHHGSKTSSTMRFVNAVHPEYAVFSLGYKNRYRFPHKKVVARYEQIGANLVDTASGGALRFKIAANTPISQPEEYRKKHKRIWHLT